MYYRRMQPAVHKPGGGGIMEWFKAYEDALDSGYFKVIDYYTYRRSHKSLCGLCIHISLNLSC